jgi:predicted PurR-regulated permease PerM
MDKSIISKVFLITIIVAVLYLVYQIFRPFLSVILIATILVTIFYTPYQQLVKLLKGRRNIAAFIMCVMIALLVILPLANFIAYTAQRSVVAYDSTIQYLESRDLGGIIKGGFLNRFNVLDLSSETVQNAFLEVAKKVNSWLANGAGAFLKGTTSFIISLFLIFLSMFFFFVDGEKMLNRLMYLTPLPNKYDREIFKKFRDVSYSTVVSTFVTAIAQGIIGAIGFVIVGLPAFFPGIAMAFLSLLPYVGAAFIWFPAGIYLLFIGKIWQGIFLLIWGGAVVSTVDNLLKAYIIKGKAQVHPIFIIFSILGGIVLFGFWGVIFGPLIISLAVTLIHIYELEYGKVLKQDKS